METIDKVETIEYRVALIDSSSSMLMVSDLAVRYRRLPRVRVSKRRRQVEGIGDALRREFQLNAMVLTLFCSQDKASPFAIAEVIRSGNTRTTHTLVLDSIDSIPDTELAVDERLILLSIISGDKSDRRPFLYRGWLADAQEWIRECTRDRSIRLTGEFRQYNASDTFALLRFHATDGTSYWLKAAGELNKHEYTLTVELSRLFAPYLPALLGVHDNWNAWITEDAGEPLSSVYNLEHLRFAVGALADLQIRSLQHVDRLRAHGCMDRRLTRLRLCLPAIFSFLEDAMRTQSSTKVGPLTSKRLREICAVVDQACEEMLELDIPDCLVNGDINLNNILVSDFLIRFIDWAEGGIGNPFLTLQQVIQHVVREGEHIDWSQHLLAAYKNKWLAVLEGPQIDAAFALMPLLTMTDYLCGRGDWLRSSRGTEPWFQSFARTMGRYMDRAATDLVSAGGVSL